MGSVDEQYLMRLKRKIATSRTEADKAQGKVDQCMSTLKTKYKCESVEEAEKKKATLDKRREDIVKKTNALIDEMKERYQI